MSSIRDNSERLSPHSSDYFTDHEEKADYERDPEDSLCLGEEERYLERSDIGGYLGVPTVIFVSLIIVTVEVGLSTERLVASTAKRGDL